MKPPSYLLRERSTSYTSVSTQQNKGTTISTFLYVTTWKFGFFFPTKLTSQRCSPPFPETCWGSSMWCCWLSNDLSRQRQLTWNPPIWFRLIPVRYRHNGQSIYTIITPQKIPPKDIPSSIPSYQSLDPGSTWFDFKLLPKLCQDAVCCCGMDL